MCTQEQPELLLLGNNRLVMYDLYHAMLEIIQTSFEEFIGTYVIWTQSYIFGNILF